MLTVLRRFSLFLLSATLIILPIDNNGVLKASEDQQDEIINKNFYLIGPGDVIGLEILNEPELSRNLEVLVDGSISLPLIGRYEITGDTLEGAAKKIENLYLKELLSPTVFITLIRSRPINVAVTGEVQIPGIYNFKRNNKLNTTLSSASSPFDYGLPTVINAIQNAGGLTNKANIKNISIKRRLPGKENEYKLANLNLLDAIYEGDHSQNILLYDGDVIEIKPASKLEQDVVAVTENNLSKNEISIYVVGEVVKPGRMTVRSRTSLASAILAAGGTKNERANKANVELIRANKNGTITQKKYRLNYNIETKSDENPILQDKDIVRVRRSLLAQGSDSLGTVTRPLRDIFSIYTFIKVLDD